MLHRDEIHREQAQSPEAEGMWAWGAFATVLLLVGGLMFFGSGDENRQVASTNPAPITGSAP